MTPQEHLDQAEKYLSRAEDSSDDWDSPFIQSWGIMGLVHAVIAIADVLGVPHPQPDAEVTTGAR